VGLQLWQIEDGTKRDMWQVPTSLHFWTYPIAPSWPIVKGGQINQTLYTDSSITILPQFIFQGLRKYASPVAWRPNYVYREVPYMYVLPINYRFNTVTPTAFNSQSNYQIVNNYAFKLQRMQFMYKAGPNNTAAAAALGAILYDWQARQLMSNFVNTQFIDFNATDSNGNFIYGPHASFPAVPLLYPVNGQIRIDLTDMNCPVSGAVSDIQGQILLQGVNLIPCGVNAPGARRPDGQLLNDPATDLQGGASQMLPYIYTANMLNMAQNKATFASSNKFTLSLDGDSEFIMTAVHNTQTATITAPPS
jgi:hypothetical protein